VSDDDLLARAERALTEIKVNHGLSEDHAAVLAALRLRLSGTEGGTLEEMLAAADDATASTLEQKFAELEGAPKKPSLDDLLGGS
jgi:hypothetical protein